MQQTSRSHSIPALVLAVAAASACLPAEETPIGHQPLSYIGYFHDGSGVFPGCTPVTSWREWTVLEEKQSYTDDKGREKTRKVRKLETEVDHNIVYKVPHINWCNGGMIIAGGKLFGLSDRGGLGFYSDYESNFAGAELFCIDPATGKELWKRDMDHWDLTPHGAEMSAFIKEYNKRQLETFGAYLPLGTAMRARSGGFVITEEHYQELIKPLKGLMPDLPPTYAECIGHPLIDHKGYPQGQFFEKIQPKYWPEIDEMRKKVQKTGYLQDPWGGCDAPLGLNMQTPVSDGEHIWVATAYGGLFCLDLDGNFVWRRYQGPGWYRAAAIPSPILVGNLLITIGLDDQARERGTFDKRDQKYWQAFAKDTGDLVWQAPFNGSYQPGPLALDLPVGGDTSSMMTVLYFHGDGKVLRASDGQLLADGLPAVWSARPAVVDGDIVLCDNKKADGGGGGSIKNDFEKGWSAQRLSAPTADRVEHECLWQGKEWDWSNIVARDGVVYHMHGKRYSGGIESYDIRTGEQIAKDWKTDKQNDGGLAGSMHWTALVGDYVIGLDTKGYSGVARVSRDGKQVEVIGTSHLGVVLDGKGKNGGEYLGGKFSYGCQFFASGNRIFIRSMTDLYCIGDPSAETVLSPEHR